MRQSINGHSLRCDSRKAMRILCETFLLLSCSSAFCQTNQPTQFSVSQPAPTRKIVRNTVQDSVLPIGFGVADEDGDKAISRGELRKYLKPRLKGLDVPYAKIFSELDTDGDDELTEQEFEPRNEIIQKFVEELYPPIEIAPDPGPGYKLFAGLDRPINDSLAYSAIYHRTLEATKKPNNSQIDLESIPLSATGSYRRILTASGLERACTATVVVAGGKSDEDFFSGGGVIISPDGLMLTNYHIAESINDGLIAILADGRVANIERIIAANPNADVALVKLAGQNLPYVPVATARPSMASTINMVHHSENRFYTFDQGYVKRYPLLQGDPWMEVSMPFAPGGSGCGIFNDRYELVGLVCFISMGDGPSLAGEPPASEEDQESQDEEPAYLEMSSLVVRLAVPLQSIQALWGQQPSAPALFPTP